MVKTLSGILLVAGAIGSWFIRGTLEHWFFDKVLKQIPPYPDWSWAIEYAPPALLTSMAVWMIWTGTRQRPSAPPAAETSSATAQLDMANHPSQPPKQTIVAMPESRGNALWWHMGSSGGQSPQPMMQVCADINVTNIWDRNVRLAGAVLRFRWRFIFRRVERGDILVKDSRSPYSGSYPIAPNAMGSARVHFMFHNPVRKAGEHFVADLGIVDQFNNHHWIEGLRFDYQ